MLWANHLLSLWKTRSPDRDSFASLFLIHYWLALSFYAMTFPLLPLSVFDANASGPTVLFRMAYRFCYGVGFVFLPPSIPAAFGVSLFGVSLFGNFRKRNAKHNIANETPIAEPNDADEMPTEKSQ